MKVKVLSRNPDDYVRETKLDIQRGKSETWSKTGLASKLNLLTFPIKRLGCHVANILIIKY